MLEVRLYVELRTNENSSGKGSQLVGSPFNTPRKQDHPPQ